MNGIGVDKENVEILLKKLIREKLEFLDEYSTFNCDKYDSKYLLKLNKFLFGDIYDNLNYRFEEYRKMVDNYLSIIINECIGNKNLDVIFSNLESIWHIQPFEVGNTRTIVAFIKVINQSFLLGLDMNLDTNIHRNMNFRELIKNNKLLK